MLIGLKAGDERHAKVAHVGNEAYGAWCRMRQWSSAHDTRGFVPDAIAELFCGSRRVLARLLTAPKPYVVALLERRDGGYLVHDCAEDVHESAGAAVVQ
jgi:hypothetical protein